MELSFEFFPPRNNKEYKSLEETYKVLSKFEPTFVSFTDGAGASKNRDIIKSVKILRKYSETEVVAHITSCDKEKIDVSSLSKGVYQITFEGLKTNETRKLIKE